VNANRRLAFSADPRHQTVEELIGEEFSAVSPDAIFGLLRELFSTWSVPRCYMRDLSGIWRDAEFVERASRKLLWIRQGNSSGT
jgi:hypothetical protein